VSVIRVSLPGRSYEIKIGGGLLSQTGPEAARVLRGRKIAVVTDSNVAPLLGGTVLESLRGAGFDAALLTVPAGEKSKSPAMLARLWEQMASFGLTRADAVAALGGGVVGDLAGFAAATLLRGVDLIQLPTTLLAQVDSSIGGKVAVDLDAGKNLAGCFYQPKLVLMDTGALASLPDRTFSDGMAEVVKYGCIFDEPFFRRLLACGSRAGVMAEIESVDAVCCDWKRKTVERDERDTGERMLLNFGHTFGHVYEKYYRYETYTHGEAVAAGMISAARLGERLGVTEPGTAARIGEILRVFGLPTEIDAPREALEETMRIDKKTLGGEIRFIFLRRIGEAEAVSIPLAELFEQL